MEEITITSVVEFLSRPLWDTKTMIFRGVSKSSYELSPSIARIPLKSSEDRFEYEEQILEDFQEKAFPHLKYEPKNSLEWLFLAQHYGIPTRLLDWTTNPLVALFFAVEKNDGDDGAVYKTIQKKWIIGAEVAFDIEEEVGLRPKHTDVRYINQSGIFTIHPTHRMEADTKHFTKYIVPKSIKSDIRWQLYKYGIRPSFIYPGLDGVAKDVIEENRSLLFGGTVRTNRNWLEGIT
jgi:hypothetical protein